MKARGAALIIGFTIQGLALARALARSQVKAYALVHRDVLKPTILKHPALYSKDVQFIPCEGISGDRIVDSLLKVRGLIPEEKVVLFPVTDNTVMALGKNWHRLADHYLLSWASCRERIEQVVLKSNLPALCSTAGVDYPGTSIIRADKDIDDCLAKLPLPILLKPEKQTFSFKTRRCDTQEEFRKFVRSEVGDWPLIAQEWIEGSERELYFYSCFMRDGVEHFGFTGRKVRTSPKGVGIATVIETCDEVQVRDAARKLLPVLNICGPVAMEFKKDQVGRLYFIEANVGRTEFCVDLAIQAGFNLPLLEFNYATGSPLPTVDKWEDCVWYDTDKEPFCYSLLCLKELTLSPHGKKAIFPYHRQEGWRVRCAAALEVTRKCWNRALARSRIHFSTP